MPQPLAKVARIMPEVTVEGVKGAVVPNGSSTLKYHIRETDGKDYSLGNGASSAENNGGADGDIHRLSNGHAAVHPQTQCMEESENVGDGSELLVKRLSEDAKLPKRGSPHAAGLDLYSAEEKTIPAKGKALVPTKLAITVPVGSYGRIAPRSGLAWKHFIDVGAGVIDHDYTGEVGVLLFNFSDMPYFVKKHERVAQLVIEKIFIPKIKEVDELPKTKRGATGYGASGKH